MNSPSRFRAWLGDAWLALVVTGLTAVALSRQVTELDGKLVVLAGAGLAGILLAVVGLQLVNRSATVPATLAPPSTTSAPLPPPAVGAALPTSFAPVTLVGFEAFSLPKHGSADEDNEDNWAVADEHGLVAVSDGASSSFGARVWSGALVASVMADKGGFEPDLVGRCVATAAERWTAHHTQGEVAWWAQEGLRRGAFATLLAVELLGTNGGREWRAMAVGDSCLLHLRRTAGGWSLLRSFPVETAEGFGSHPDLLSSVNFPPAAPVLAKGTLAAGDVLVAATDAVSEWLLGDTARLAFAAAAPLELVRDTVAGARVDRSMVNDDATFVRYREA